mmetsp:Transcript_4698/g.4877  ORF Transcript_4698/g.4877 Transcript_4698/m.4877 type:complete len:263 (-) Transcript_4698:36-824(-)
MNIDDRDLKEIQFSKELEVDYTEIDVQKGYNSPRELFKHLIDPNQKNSKKQESDYSCQKYLSSKNFSNNENSQEYSSLVPADVDESNDCNTCNNLNGKLIDNISDLHHIYKSTKISSTESDKFPIYEIFAEKYMDYVNELYFSELNKKENSPERRTSTVEEKLDKESIYNNTGKEFKFTSLDFLLNPLRTSLPFEKWSPYEIALFETCICKYGKDFELFTHIISTKTLEEIQEFYFCWEKTKYYSSWLSTQIRKGKFPNKLF